MSPNRVELLPHDPDWTLRAEVESAALRAVVGDILLVVHHIGSTAIAGIHAKPVIDLMSVVRSLDALDALRDGIESLGYEWCGEFGLPGRRYCRRDDPGTGRRLVQVHAYAEGHGDIVRHLAFRDFLRTHSDVAHAYDREKQRCQRLHPDDSRAYGACKSDWIRAVEARALQAAAVSTSTESFHATH